jgi:hypothetical protein
VCVSSPPEEPPCRCAPAGTSRTIACSNRAARGQGRGLKGHRRRPRPQACSIPSSSELRHLFVPRPRSSDGWSSQAPAPVLRHSRHSNIAAKKFQPPQGVSASWGAWSLRDRCRQGGRGAGAHVAAKRLLGVLSSVSLPNRQSDGAEDERRGRGERLGLLARPAHDVDSHCSRRQHSNSIGEPNRDGDEKRGAL